MSFTYEVNKVMLIDGILFIIPGINLILFPNPKRSLKTKLDSKTVLPPFKDIRILLGAAYASIGIIVAVLGGIIDHTDELNAFAIARAISLMFIVYAISMQIVRKKWEWRGMILLYLVFYSILIVIYLFFGFVEPLPLQN